MTALVVVLLLVEFALLLGALAYVARHLETTIVVHSRKTTEVVARLVVDVFNRERESTMADLQDFAELEEQVTKNTDAEASAVELLNSLAARLTAAAGHPEKVHAIATSLRASAEKLSAAIVANTPAT